MKAEHFMRFVKHLFICETFKSMAAVPLGDNHDSHLSVAALISWKGKGVTVLSFPSHCSHKLQPLDRSVYWQLKSYINRACDAWVTNQPGQTMTIYDLPGIINTSLHLAATPANIKAGFKVAGIYPYKINVFPEE
jgi:hypothetical protein